MINPSPRISFTEKLGYAVGDAATNFFFQAMMLYQNRFYTDTVGLSPSSLGWMFLIVRWSDAFFDPVFGALSDRTNTRWGKFRPWVLWAGIPFGLLFWLVYVTPNVGPQWRLVYAWVTYILVMIAYSANNTPYSALMGVMTPDVEERSNIARFRFVSALIGQFLIQALALPLVDKFGAGNSAKGWACTMAIFGAIIIICNVIVFFFTKERVAPPPGQESSLKSLAEDIRNVFTCRPWLVMFVVTLLIFTTLALRGSSLNYMIRYYVDPAAMTGLLNKIGLGAGAAGDMTGWQKVLDALGLLVKPDYSNSSSVGFSFFFTLGSIIQILGILISKPLSDFFGKKTVFITGLSVTTLATAAIFYVQPTDVNQMLFWSVVWPLGWGPTVPLLWVMMADVADYSEWKTSRRATGFVFAGIVFALKAGLGVGGALASWIIGAYGYVPNATQTPHALLGIRLSATYYSAIPFALCIVCLALYPITKSMNLQIQDELVERRKKFEAKAPLAGT
jgi:Na+/melibiose symporter-like transporter